MKTFNGIISCRRLAAFAAAALLAVLPTAAQVKQPQPTPVKRPFSESLQAVVVVTDSMAAIKGKARLFERRTVKDKWKGVGGEFPVVVGRSGLAWTAESGIAGVTDLKAEGDGRSPAGLFPLTATFGRDAKTADMLLPHTQLGEYTECVDDPQSRHYNRIVDRMAVGVFDWKSAEKMQEMGMIYDLGIFVGYNSYPAVKGRGSCIFLHIWSDAATGTAGCTAMDRDDLRRIVEWMIPSRVPYLVQMTKEDLKRYRKEWDLPKM